MEALSYTNTIYRRRTLDELDMLRPNYQVKTFDNYPPMTMDELITMNIFGYLLIPKKKANPSKVADVVFRVACVVYSLGISYIVASMTIQLQSCKDCPGRLYSLNINKAALTVLFLAIQLPYIASMFFWKKHVTQI